MPQRQIKRLISVLVAYLVPMAVEAGGPYQFYSITPCRIVDTRNANGPTGGPALTSGAERDFPITGLCGIPTTAQQVFLNITVVNPTQAGWLALWPYNTPRPVPYSNINFPANSAAIANGAIVTLTADPNFNVAVWYGAPISGTTNVLLDVLGYLQ